MHRGKVPSLLGGEGKGEGVSQNAVTLTSIHSHWGRGCRIVGKELLVRDTFSCVCSDGNPSPRRSRDSRANHRRCEKRGRRDRLCRRIADLRWKKGIDGARGGLQQEIPPDDPDPFCRRAANVLDGSAANHRGESRQKVLNGFFSGLSISFCAASPGKDSRERQLGRNISMGNERDGDFSRRGGSRLYLTQRNHL